MKTINDQAKTENTEMNNIHKNKWGYYPCSKETYLKLKMLRKAYFESQVQAAAWFRWARKTEKNRKGTEPYINPLFCSKTDSSDYFRIIDRSKGRYGLRTDITCWVKSQSPTIDSYVYIIPGKTESYQTIRNNKESIIVSDLGILAEFVKIRFPRQTLEEAQSIIITLAEKDIDSLLEKMTR